MYRLPDNILQRLIDRAGASVISKGLRGIEKESLRIDPFTGSLAGTGHPEALGSALSHPFITTDYAESLLEFVTPALATNEEAIQFLQNVHKFTYERIGNEVLWPCSMPCGFSKDSDVPLARYGSSNVGKMKTVYRRGLGLRYGRIMQTIAGVHFNYSLPPAFWPALQSVLRSGQDSQDFQSTGYFALIRNFRRMSWLVLYLFGSSPAVCKSFFQNEPAHLEDIGNNTAAGATATSLRMSDIGYSNDAQANLNISINSLDEYVAGLTRAITTPHPSYEKIGLYDNDRRQQLSTSVLQIANEYYSGIRPKRVTHSGEKPTTALRERGVEYVEVRSLDLDPFSDTGVNKKQLNFMECLLLHCALTNSPAISPTEQVEIDHNDNLVATNGRSKDILLHSDGEKLALPVLAERICEQLLEVADILDHEHGGSEYRSGVEHQMTCINDSSNTPAARLLQALQEGRLSYHEFGLARAQQIAQTYKNDIKIDRTINDSFASIASQSLDKTREVEASDTLNFEDYLTAYFSQL